MKKAGGPVRDFTKLQKKLDKAMGKAPELDFDNTEITFAHLSDAELKQSGWLFGVMNKPWLTNSLSGLGLHAVKWGLPGAAWAMKKTIYPQFVGGTSLLASQDTIDQLYAHGVYSVLDYGAEGKEEEADFNSTMKEVMRGIDFASHSDAIPVVVTKISGMATSRLLENMQQPDFTHTDATEKEYSSVMKRLDAICSHAAKNGVKIFFDAEESWIQNTLDDMATIMMERYNQHSVTVYNTFQLYRHDRLAFLKKSHERARKNNYMLGAKLVRGAYMEKENERAKEKGYPTPIQPSLEATHRDFNAAVRYCVDHYLEIASCNASHNRESVRLQTQLIEERNLPRRHEHLNVCQLLGMSGNLTCNLAAAGYNVAKYLVYGPVKDVAPYLIRRAQENTSVTGDMSRELRLIRTEIERRGL